MEVKVGKQSTATCLYAMGSLPKFCLYCFSMCPSGRRMSLAPQSTVYSLAVYNCVSTTLEPSVRRRGALRRSQFVVSACRPENLQATRALNYSKMTLKHTHTHDTMLTS